MYFYDKKPIGMNFNKVEFYINASSAGHCGWTSSKKDETFELDQDIDKHIVKNTCIKDKDLVYVEGASIRKTVGEFDIRGKDVAQLLPYSCSWLHYRIPSCFRALDLVSLFGW